MQFIAQVKMDYKADLSFLHDCIGEERGVFIDPRDSNCYSWIQVGDQTWMTENLRFKSDSGCFVYKGRERTLSKIGYLYDRETSFLVAPEGWHLPSEEEYLELLRNVGGQTNSTIGKFNPSACFSFFEEHRDDFQFYTNAVYYPDSDNYFNGIWHFRKVQLWTSNYVERSDGTDTSQSSSFVVDYFRKSSGVAFVKSTAAMPIRCVKDK
jgi:uncharacterized protein (TIGR02145 family)